MQGPHNSDEVRRILDRLHLVTHLMVPNAEYEYLAITFMRMVRRHPEWAAAIIAMTEAQPGAIRANDALLDIIVAKCPVTVEQEPAVQS